LKQKYKNLPCQFKEKKTDAKNHNMVIKKSDKVTINFIYPTEILEIQSASARIPIGI
jgi:hypothetical protein